MLHHFVELVHPSTRNCDPGNFTFCNDGEGSWIQDSIYPVASSMWEHVLFQSKPEPLCAFVIKLGTTSIRSTTWGKIGESRGANPRIRNCDLGISLLFLCNDGNELSGSDFRTPYLQMPLCGNIRFSISKLSLNISLLGLALYLKKYFTRKNWRKPRKHDRNSVKYVPTAFS